MTKAYCYPGAKRITAAARLAGFSESVNLGTATDVSGKTWQLNELLVAGAIASQESSGNSWEIGPMNNNGSNDYGTWQINNFAHRDTHPEWFAAGAPKLNWANHVDNAVMAKVIYDEAVKFYGANKGFLPWVAYTAKRYLGWNDESKGITHLAWAQKGIDAVKAELSSSRPLEIVASIYLENLPLVK